MKELIERLEEKGEVLTEDYSHYWEHPGFDDQQWSKLKKAAKAIFQKAIKKGVALAGPSGDGKPEISGYSIALNGKRPDQYDEFVLRKGPQEFEYTKTAKRPYDGVVVSLLAAAKKIHSEFKPSSDGGDSAIKRVF